MNQVRRVLLVTDELYPFTHGGIGRLLYNLILDSFERSAFVEFHVLVPAGGPIQPDRVATFLEGRVQTHTVVFTEGWEPAVEFDNFYPPPSAFTDSRWHAQSLDICRALRRLEASGYSFDVIEFPDYRGWAFCTLQEKHSGNAFLSSEIVVRLHSTDGVLQHFEPRPLTPEQLGRFEIERKTLLDADRIVAHLCPVAEFNCAYYGFDKSWLQKVSIEFPRVIIGIPAYTVRPKPLNLVFATKLQEFKRPRLFIRAAVQFMRRRKDFAGKAIFACHGFDESYKQQINSMVPTDLRQRFVLFQAGISPSEREKIISGSITVIPSVYESLCLTAYEASASGATLVLNGACVAFGDRTPFRHGENCYKFDGSVEGLVAALEMAWDQPQLQPLMTVTDIPYWEKSISAPPPPSVRKSDEALVSVIITNYNLGRYLPEALSSIAASTYGDIEIILVDDASTDDLDLVLLENLENEAANTKTALKVVRNPVNRGLAASRNIAIDQARGKYVMPLDADDCISSRFIEIGVQALENGTSFDAVVPQAAYFRTDDELAARSFTDYAVFLGDVPSLGLVENRFGCATCLMRRSLFHAFSYNESLTCYEDWDLYLRLCLSGHRFLVTNDVHFYYRDRTGSMVKEARDPYYHVQALARLFETIPGPLPAAVRLFALLTPAVQLAIDRHEFLKIQAGLKADREVLDAIHASLGWRFVDKWWRFKKRALPVGSLRRRAWDYPLVAIKNILR